MGLMNTNFFGTDGIRKKVGVYPLTPVGAVHIGSAIAQWALRKYNGPISIAIATDTRASKDVIKSGLITGLLAHGIALHDAGILPTPGMYHLVKHYQQFQVGIVVSASHNGYQDNGIKIIDSSQSKISSQDEHEISLLIEQFQDVTTQEPLGHTVPLLHAKDSYAQYMLGLFDTPFLTHKKVVLDCAHGATSSIAPHVFSQLGAHVITINNSPNGTNINDKCGSVNPEQLVQAVIKAQADIGFAFDGDGDRVIAVSRSGEIKDGDHLLAILSQHADYKHQETIVGTIMSNQGLVYALEQQAKELIRTAVGDRHVTEYMSSRKLLLGAEPSGHVILADYMLAADGIFTALKVAHTLEQTTNWDMHTFAPFPAQLVNMMVDKKHNLENEPFHSLITLHNSMLEAGRIIVRYSGTENMLRVLVEDMHEELVLRVSKELSKALHDAHKEL